MDDHNVRLLTYLHGESEENIIKYLLLDAATVELMQAIAENGFFVGEQLFVIKYRDEKFKVIKGNRRLIAVKLLQNPKAKRWEKPKELNFA